MNLPPAPASGSANASFAARLFDLLFPRFCAACEQPLNDRGVDLCTACATRLAASVSSDYCGCCGEDVGPHLLTDRRCTTCQNRQPWFEQLRRVGRYERTLRDLVIRFKYGSAPTLDAMLGDLMYAAAAGARAMNDVRIWVPVPSARRRLWRRGYQPTRLLADRLAARTGRPRRSILRLGRSIAEQKTLVPEDRISNVRDAFCVTRGVDLTGLTVGLVDDVHTSGATLREASRTLRGAGAERVVAVVLAVAKPGKGV